MNRRRKPGENPNAVGRRALPRANPPASGCGWDSRYHSFPAEL